MEKDVTRNIEEQLSAFLDGELPEEELALLVRRLERDEAHRATLDRYALLGGVLRNETDVAGGLRMRKGIMAALDDSQPAAQPAGVQPAADKSPVRYLLAASVAIGAVAFLLAGNLFTPQNPETPVPALAATGPTAVVASEPAQIVQASTAAAELEAARERHQRELQRIRMKQERMRSYLISHREYSSPLQGAIADSRMYVQQASFSE